MNVIWFYVGLAGVVWVVAALISNFVCREKPVVKVRVKKLLKQTGDVDVEFVVNKTHTGVMTSTYSIYFESGNEIVMGLACEIYDRDSDMLFTWLSQDIHRYIDRFASFSNNKGTTYTCDNLQSVKVTKVSEPYNLEDVYDYLWEVEK